MSSNNNDQNFEDESDNEHDFYQLVLAGCVATLTITSFKEKKKPFRTSSHTGYKFVMDVLNYHEIKCFEQFRMEKHVFMNLLETLTKRCGLKEGLMCP